MSGEAIFIRTHYFDNELARFYETLKQEAGREVFLVCEETNGVVDAPPNFAKIALNRDKAAGMGLHVPKDMGWRCGDYFYYFARDAEPRFSAYWLVEGDVRFKFDDVSSFFNHFPDSSAIDFIAPYFRKAGPSWGWLKSISAFVPSVYACLFPLTRLSAGAIDHLKQERVKLSEEYQKLLSEESINTEYPNDEAFVCSILVRDGFECRDINDFDKKFCDNETFRFEAPHSANRIASAINDDRIFHPVLKGEGFWSKVNKDLNRHKREKKSPGDTLKTFNERVINDCEIEVGAEKRGKFAELMLEITRERNFMSQSLLDKLSDICIGFSNGIIEFLKAWIFRGNTIVLDFTVCGERYAFDLLRESEGSLWRIEIICRDIENAPKLQRLNFKSVGPARCILGTFSGAEDFSDAELKAVADACKVALERLQSLGAKPRSAWLSTADDVITLLDVGARNGLDPRWEVYIDELRPVLVEPEPEEAKALAERYASVGGIVLCCGLSDREGEHTLHITQAVTCSSFLKPNFELMNEFPSRDWFKIEREIQIPARRYDNLVKEGSAPAPDVVKVDVQGFEYEVLTGFGDYLNQVLAVELETQVYPMYRDQKLLSDIIALLDRYGLRLRALREQNSRHFKGQNIEFNAFFIRSKGFKDEAIAHRKLATVQSIWHVPDF